MWTLPNIITLVRIALTPVIALLPFIQGYWPKFICFIVFLAAAISDVIDGRFARSRQQITDLGKLLDPIADKLLLLATLLPIYFISRTRHAMYDIPVWGSIPLWVCLCMIVREFAMTAFQNIFIGATMLWFTYQDARKPLGWEHGPFAEFWTSFHGWFVAIALFIALT